MKVRYYCHYGRLTGYGRAAHDYLLALHQYTDLEIEIAPLGPFDPSFYQLEPRYAELAALVTQGGRHPDVYVLHTTPARVVDAPGAWGVPGDRPLIVYTTWETFDLPEPLIRALGAARRILVPSDFCREAMAPDGELGQIEVLPHCYDPDFWRPPFQVTMGDEFRFYNIGAWSERKNQLGLIKAYLHAFSRTDPVSLTLSSADADINMVSSLLARSGIPREEWPRLEITDPARLLSEAELLDLHQGGSCFVSATRGEGFGLGHFEAAVLGKPIITPLWGGQEEFLKHRQPAEPPGQGQVRDVDYQLAPVFPEARFTEAVGGMAKMIVPAAVGLSCKQAWAEPDLLDLGNKMNHIVAAWQRGDLTEPAQAWADQAPTRYVDYTYEPVAKRYAAILQEVASG